MEACTQEAVAVVAMLVVSIITALQIWYVKKRRKIENKELAVSALVGFTLGLLLDVVVGKVLGLWHYTRHPYWTNSYWAVLPAMWTEFGIGVYILWRIVRPRLLVVPILMVVYEVYGIMRGSWHYPVDWWVVALGWVPLILTIVVLTNILLMKFERTSSRRLFS